MVAKDLVSIFLLRHEVEKVKTLLRVVSDTIEVYGEGHLSLSEFGEQVSDLVLL